MSHPLLLDEMLSDAIAKGLRAKGHDVVSVLADPDLVELADDQVLAHATSEGRAVVTVNVRDFVALDGHYRAAGLSHAGLILVSAKTFAQDRGFVGAMTAALARLLARSAKIQPGEVMFLSRN